MASPSLSAVSSQLPAERFFRVSLFLLMLTGAVCIVSTGKLDLLSSVLVVVGLLYKGHRWWNQASPEISTRVATWLVTGYLGFFPIDIFVFSRMYSANSTNPVLYATLFAAIHFLFFITLVRLYSAANDRDAMFLAMLSFAAVLASAVLTVDTTFLILFFVYMLFAVAVFATLELRRGVSDAVPAELPNPQERERRMARALSVAVVMVTFGAICTGAMLFFFFPRFSAGYMGHSNMNTTLMSGFSDEVELGEIGEIKKNTAVVLRVQTGEPVEYDRLRWRGIALATFDGTKWSSGGKGPTPVFANGDGWIPVTSAPQAKTDRSRLLQYTVLMEPMASDALFIPGVGVAVRGNFSSDRLSPFGGRGAHLFRDASDSVFNPFHNYAAMRYFGVSRLPQFQIDKLRTAGTNYPDGVRESYLQLPSLDPRIPALAQSITARAVTPVDKAIALEGYLRSRYAYTLDLAGKPGKDPLAYFLFQKRAGHCEYFASAMAVMLRTLGIPSREINGFLPGEYNSLGGDFGDGGDVAHAGNPFARN